MSFEFSPFNPGVDGEAGGARARQRRAANAQNGQMSCGWVSATQYRTYVAPNAGDLTQNSTLKTEPVAAEDRLFRAVVHATGSKSPAAVTMT